jgi:hypothetical protein
VFFNFFIRFQYFPCHQTLVNASLVLFSLFCFHFTHLINDLMQSVIPAFVYPILKENLVLNFTQIRLITFVYQPPGPLYYKPFIGFYTDKNRCFSYSLKWWIGLVDIIQKRHASLLGSRKRGLAQSIFQLGGNTGSAIGTVVGYYNCGTLWSIEYHLVCVRYFLRNIRFG